MQPEEIIQDKEWQQLTKEEREIIAPLVASEGEYNVLKKMLQLVEEDADDVPAVTPLVQQQLQEHLKKPAMTKSMFVWYAAAACVVLIAIALYFLLPQKPKHEIAHGPTAPPPVQQKNRDSLKREKPVPNINATNEPTEIVKQIPIKVDRQKRAVSLPPGVTHRDAAANTSVANSEELLSFVTEVY